MSYYVVQRKMQITETVLVKAVSKMQAFNKAAEDIKCKTMTEIEGDWEPDFNSIREVEYVSNFTKEQIG